MSNPEKDQDLSQNPYTVLGIEKDADSTQIDEARDKKIVELNEEIGKAKELTDETAKKEMEKKAALQLDAINEAYATLSDPEKKKAYDSQPQGAENEGKKDKKEPSDKAKKLIGECFKMDEEDGDVNQQRIAAMMNFIIEQYQIAQEKKAAESAKNPKEQSIKGKVFSMISDTVQSGAKALKDFAEKQKQRWENEGGAPDLKKQEPGVKAPGAEASLDSKPAEHEDHRPKTPGGH